MRIINTSEAVREATTQLLEMSDRYFLIGEGVPDPKACFETTRGLQEKFPNQVFDMPVSENGITGVCIGAAIGGMRPIMVHMRCDFLLYAADQIVNNAAKWFAMYGGNGGTVPMVIRAFIGRGWGAGIQHSQNLLSTFAHIPGLKVVCPSNAYNAKGLLIAAAQDPNPVLMLEHRWVHPVLSEVPEEMYEVPIGKAQIVEMGDAITIVSWGHMMNEVRAAAKLLRDRGIKPEIIDMLSLRPLDTETVCDSFFKTRNILVVDEDWKTGSLAGEILATVAASGIPGNFRRLCNPDYSPPSTHFLTKYYYPTHLDIASYAAMILDKKIDLQKETEEHFKKPQDVPNAEFKGPF